MNKKILAHSFAACLFMLSTSCSATTSPYPLIDSGAWADGTGLSSAYNYWIDNSRILFRSVKDNNKHLAYQGPFNLSIWEIGKGVKQYTDHFPSVTACMRSGIIHRTQKDIEGNVHRFYGKFGEEQPFEFPKTKGTFFHEMECRPNDNPDILDKRQNNRAIIPLLDRHGYLDIGPIKGEGSSDNPFVKLYRRGQQEPVALAIRKGDALGRQGLQYYEFKDAYFSWVAQHTDKSGTGRWLYPDGRVEEIKIPAGTWQLGIQRAYPVREGIFMVSYNSKSGRDPGQAGGYLLKHGQFVKIIDGSIYGVAVSPDGCKVAFSHVLYHDADIASSNDPTLRTLKLIDFCQRRK